MSVCPFGFCEVVSEKYATHSTYLACIHSLMRSPCPYINLHVIDMALLEQVSDLQLESELSGGNNVTLDFFFAVL